MLSFDLCHLSIYAILLYFALGLDLGHGAALLDPEAGDGAVGGPEDLLGGDGESKHVICVEYRTYLYIYIYREREIEIDRYR